MDDSTTQDAPSTTIGRRDVIKRGAFVVGAATLWSTPVVQTLGMRAAAASTYDGETECDGMPKRLVWRYEPTGCAPASNPPLGKGTNTPVKVSCEDLTGCTETAQITVRNTTGGGGTANFSVAPGGTFTVTGIHNNGGVGPNNRFTITACGKTQDFEIHTSCSADLGYMFRFYSLVLVGIYND